MALKDAPTSVLLENVLSLIHQKLPKNSASLVECFVAKFYGNMASTDLHDRNDSDLMAPPSVCGMPSTTAPASSPISGSTTPS